MVAAQRTEEGAGRGATVLQFHSRSRRVLAVLQDKLAAQLVIHPKVLYFALSLGIPLAVLAGVAGLVCAVGLPLAAFFGCL